MLEQYSNVEVIDGRRVVVRNGYLPEREIVTAVGPVPVKIPKVRDHLGSGVKFNSTIVPPYVHRSPRVSSSLPWLYLRGVSTSDVGDAPCPSCSSTSPVATFNTANRLRVPFRVCIRSHDSRRARARQSGNIRYLRSSA